MHNRMFVQIYASAVWVELLALSFSAASLFLSCLCSTVSAARQTLSLSLVLVYTVACFPCTGCMYDIYIYIHQRNSAVQLTSVRLAHARPNNSQKCKTIAACSFKLAPMHNVSLIFLANHNCTYYNTNRRLYIPPSIVLPIQQVGIYCDNSLPKG